MAATVTLKTEINDTWEYAVLNENKAIDYNSCLQWYPNERLFEENTTAIFERQVVPISEAFDIMLD